MTHFSAGLMRRIWASLWLAVLPLGSVAEAADFYKDRTITFIIGSAPGGGYDTYSRLVASHLGPHIAGQPTIVPQNVPGAGSIRAANYLYNVAPKDGTTIGMVDEAIFLNQILGVQEPTTDATKLSWFGGILRRIMGTRETKTDAVKFNWIERILANSAILFVRRLTAGASSICGLITRAMGERACCPLLSPGADMVRERSAGWPGRSMLWSAIVPRYSRPRQRPNIQAA